MYTKLAYNYIRAVSAKLSSQHAIAFYIFMCRGGFPHPFLPTFPSPSTSSYNCLVEA